MGMFEKAGEIADAALRGTAKFLETGSKNLSYNKNCSEEQRQILREYSERMGDIRENGFGSLSSEDDFYEDDSCEDDSYEDDSYEDDSYEDDSYEDKCDDKNNASNIDIKTTHKKKEKEKKKCTSEGNNNSLENMTYADRKHAEREKNKKILASIKLKKDFVMKINTIQYAEKKSGKGYILSGRIRKGGIYQGEQMYVTVSHKNGNQSQHRLISVLCYAQHKKYNYGKKGQYARLFIKEEESFDMTMADSVCEVIYK